MANTAETEARAFARKAQEAVDAARENHAAAERESSHHTARMSALSEARQRIATGRDEAIAGHRENESALAALPDAVELEDKLAQVGKVIAGDREALAAVRVESQAITREAELAAQRLQTIAAEQAAWNERNQSAAAQIATLGQRAEEAKRERAELESAPEKFAAQRHALIGEIETASATRRAAADRLAEAETEQSAADKAARVALEAVGEARAEAARAEERCDGARRRVADIEHEIRDLLDVDPAGAAEVAEIKQGEETPPIADVEAKLDRLRRERERLGSVNLLAEQELRDRDSARQAYRGTRRPCRGDPAPAPGHPKPQPRSSRPAALVVRDGERAFQEAVHRAVRRRQRGITSHRERRSAGGRARNHGQTAGRNW